MKRNTLFPIFTDLGKVYSCLPSFNFSDKNIHIDTRIGYLWKNTKKKKYSGCLHKGKDGGQ